MIADRLDDDEKAKIDPKQYLGSRSNEPVTIINESGLYSVILLSRKPEAKKFKRWVTHEVLPQIRRTGGYIPVSAEDDEMIILSKAVLIGQKTMERQKELIEEMAPKAIFADAVSGGDGTVSIAELAKILKGNDMEIGGNRLYEILRQKGYLIKQYGAGYNMPSQKGMRLGLFKIKESVVELPDGHMLINKTTRVTGKGQRYFINMFLNGQKEKVDVAPKTISGRSTQWEKLTTTKKYLSTGSPTSL
jgi:anti-repressor protein